MARCVDCGDWEDPPQTGGGQCTPIRLTEDCGVPIIYANEPQVVTLPCPEGTEGDTVEVTVPAGTVNSPFSVAAANEVALALAEAQAEALREANPCVAPPVVYENEEQECCDTCPEGFTGDDICVTIAAGEYTSETSVEAANALAMAAACAQVAALRALTPCEEIPEDDFPPSVLWSWGSQIFGELGLNIPDIPFAPPEVQLEPAIVDASGLTWKCLGSGLLNSYAIKQDGSLWGAGSNSRGELGQGNTTKQVVFVRSGNALGWAFVAGGDEFAFAIKDDGTLWSCGANFNGQLGFNTTGGTHTSFAQVGSDTWIAVDCGGEHVLAIKSDGTLWSCGGGGRGQLGHGDQLDTHVFTQIGTDTWVAVSCGENNSFGIKTDGTLWSWGESGKALGLGPIPASPHIKVPNQVGSANNWSTISVSGDSGFYATVVALKTDGTIWGWGQNANGQLGLGNTTEFDTPQQIGSDTDWTEIQEGLGFTIARKSDGTLWGCGNDDGGALGQGSQTGTINSSFVSIGGDDQWGAIQCHRSHCVLAVRLTEDPPPAIEHGSASGGALAFAGGNSIHRFSGSGNFVVYTEVVADYIVVGGGGAGGGSGGGSAGQYQKLTGIHIPPGTYAVTVGSPGFPGPGIEDRGGNGGPSSFNGLTSAGGKGGGAIDQDEVIELRDGQSGYHGSGAGYDRLTFELGVGGVGVGGNSGGDGEGHGGGGGGGQGTGGFDGTINNGGVGGAGISDSITGTAIFYSAGGGGGGGSAGGAGGSSVGGGGGTLTDFATPARTAGSGGGGGQGDFFPLIAATSGFSGVVIISYPTPP